MPVTFGTNQTITFNPKASVKTLGKEIAKLSVKRDKLTAKISQLQSQVDKINSVIGMSQICIKSEPEIQCIKQVVVEACYEDISTEVSTEESFEAVEDIIQVVESVSEDIPEYEISDYFIGCEDDIDAIKFVQRKLALFYHPDKNADGL